MRFRILGPMAVHDGTRWAGIGAAKWRSLLATLLIRTTVVPIDQLVHELWGDTPPRTAATQVHGYVMRVRRAIGDPEGRVLVTAASGYQLVVGAEDVDARHFGVLAGEGRAALLAGDPRRAADVLGQALALWRGPALSDVTPSALVRTEIDRLTEAWLTAWETRVDADLECGRHFTLIGELQRHVEEHPLRERPWRQLMLALHRTGRRAEALQTYQRLRQTLVDEIGVEPCAAVQRLHQQILADPVAEGDVEPAPELLPVCQLPADVPDFTGRAEALDTIVRTLSGGGPDGPPPIAVVFGCPGVGKSTLTVHAARAVSPAFPDGQVYLDLTGTSGEPRDPAVMLAEVLRALGVTGAGVPDGVHARATVYRSMLAGRRILFVLDDAAHSDQVRPLLPPTGGCAVVITSRRLLTDLVGAVHVEVEVFQRAEARQLLASVAGCERVAREPDEAEAILRSCGYLPLAIRIAAGKLAGRPAWSLRVLSDRLADESGKLLSELRLGDLGVRASFDLSLRLLPDEAVRAFRLLGLLGAQSMPGWVVGPLLDRADADEVLDALVDANLVRLTTMDANGQPRYRLHDLLRAYAVEGAATIPEPDRRAAVHRVLAAWLNLAEQAVDGLPRSMFEPTGRPDLPATARQRLPGDPLAWFDAERTALLGAVRLAVDWGMDTLAWRLAATPAPYYDFRALYEDWQLSHSMALPAVRAAGDRQGEANLLRGLAQLHSYRDNFDAATDHLGRSLELFDLAGDKHGQGLAMAGLSSLHRILGRYDTALDHAGQAMDLVAATGDQRTEAHLRCCVARIWLAKGCDEDARTSFEMALDLCRRLGDTHREGVVLREVSLLHARHGEFGPALASVERALRIFEDIGDERCIAYTLLNTGRVYAALGDRPHAIPALERAAAIFRRYGSRMQEAKCLQALDS